MSGTISKAELDELEALKMLYPGLSSQIYNTVDPIYLLDRPGDSQAVEKLKAIIKKIRQF